MPAQTLEPSSRIARGGHTDDELESDMQEL
jgi:hypothetical protein